MHSFVSVIFKEGMLYLSEIPPEIAAKLGKSRYIPIRGFANKIPFKSTYIPRKGNRYVLFMNREIRNKITKSEGDTIELQIKYDPESKDIPLPEDVELILAEDDAILKEFLNLSPSYRREITNYIIEAKHEETRLKRINLLVERMRERIFKRR